MSANAGTAHINRMANANDKVLFNCFFVFDDFMFLSLVPKTYKPEDHNFSGLYMPSIKAVREGFQVNLEQFSAYSDPNGHSALPAA